MSTGDLVHLSEAVAERKDKRHETSLHVSRSCFFHLLTVIYIVPMLDHQESGGRAGLRPAMMRLAQQPERRYARVRTSISHAVLPSIVPYQSHRATLGHATHHYPPSRSYNMNTGCYGGMTIVGGDYDMTLF